MKTIYLAAALLVSGLAAQAQTTSSSPATPATTGTTITPNPGAVPPTQATPPVLKEEPANSGTLNQATIDMDKKTPADTKMKRATQQVKTTDKPSKSAGKGQPTTQKSSSTTKSSGSTVTTQPTTPPRP
jgi:hypothetical protein